jgi:hypothetical protein
MVDAMAWTLTKGLTNLRNQVNQAFPQRDKSSDGTIGDTAHQASTSGHNPDDTQGSRPAWNGDADSLAEVRAWDCTARLNHPDVSMQEVVDHICRLPGLSSVLRYIIFDSVIYHARTGFVGEPYSGSNPHDKHAHFEGAWTQAADNDTTFDYRLGDLMTLTSDDKKWITAEFTRLVDARVDAVAGDVAAAVLANTRFLWSADDPADPASYRRNLADLSGDTWAAIMRGTTRGGQPLPADGAFGRIEATLRSLAERIDDASTPVITPEQAIAAIQAEIRAIVRDGVA